MSENKISVAIVHEIYPICGKFMNDYIVMNKDILAKSAKNIKNLHNKTIGYSKVSCKDCAKYKDDCIFCIAIDITKSENSNYYRTGQIVGVKKDFKLFKEYPEFIITTDNDVQFCFIEENVGKQMNIFK